MSARNRPGVYLTTATVILLISSAGDPRSFGTLVTLIFPVAVGLLFWDGCVYLWWRRVRVGVVIILLAIALLVCSFMPWYGKHGTPWERQSHRHTLWELGHVH
jgi:ABC-type uncharacterized transport system permease subunit